MKLLKSAVYLSLAFLLFASCNSNEAKKIETKKLQTKAEKPVGTITYKEAAALQKEYISTRANFINEYLNKTHHFKHGELVKDENKIIQDVRDVSFDLETIKKYIAYVESEAAKKGIKGLGLRFYFGAYPNGDKRTNTPGFSTIFMMPIHKTKPKQGSANHFFYQEDDDVIPGVDGLNFGSGGRPPRDLGDD